MTAHPRWREGLWERTDPSRPGMFIVSDPYQLTQSVISVHGQTLSWLICLNGETSLESLREAMRRHLPQVPTLGQMQQTVDQLQQMGFLWTPELEARITSEERLPACIGCYSDKPAQLRRQLNRLFTADGGPGLPGERGCRIESEGRIRAILLPHIDYARGGVTYGWGFKELVERTDSELFVIVGTSHYSAARFSLTRQHFLTPLGRVETDRALVDRIAEECPGRFGHDRLAHLPEHSIELEVVLLQHLLANRGTPFRIVPLLVGSLGDFIARKRSPRTDEDLKVVMESLRRIAVEYGDRVTFVISGDLAHIGPKFDHTPHAVPLDGDALRESRRKDLQLLGALEAGSVTQFYRLIAAERDTRRICGLAPTYLTIEALGAPKALRGRLLHSQQYVDASGHESVSFASMAFAPVGKTR